MFSVTSSTLESKYYGESEKLVSALFVAARERKPSVIFIDELEWICSERKESGSAHDGRMKAELLAQMDGTKGDNAGVLVLGATNLPNSLDGAFLRRFSVRIYVPLPELESRIGLFRKKLMSKGSKHIVSDAQMKNLGQRTANYNGSDIENVVIRAKMEGIYKIRKATHFKDLGEGFYTPCTPEDNDASEMKSSDIHESKIVAPPVSFVSLSIIICVILLFSLIKL